MRTGIDFQGLMDLVKANETAREFNLNKWTSDCGTYGCLVGNYHLKNRYRSGFKPKQSVFDHGEIAARFGISVNESRYLFHSTNPLKYRWTTLYESHIGKDRNYNNKEAAINRVRKFIYYHLKKREFCLDEKGVTETSRKAGDVNFVEKVLASV